MAFSSRGFDAKVVGSKKLRVEIARDEKNGCEGNEARESRLEACRVSRRGRRSFFISSNTCIDVVIVFTFDLPTTSLPSCT